MKKLLSLLMAALLLPFALGALDLQPNQMLMAHYTSDELAEIGWGKTFLSGDNIVATDITPDELALFQGSKLIAFRVGLAESTPVTRVFVIPVDADGNPTDEVTEWSCNVSDQGWNLIELETPYEINLPDGYSLRIGFDYLQETKNSKPLSAVKAGTIYRTLHFKNGKWMNYGVNTTGNLSLQCICENDNFPHYILRTNDLYCTKNLRIGDELSFSFQAYNLGSVKLNPGDVNFEVAFDGQVVKTFSNTETLTAMPLYLSSTVNTAGLTSGQHTLTVTPTTINGEPIEDATTLSATFKCYEFGYTRQMHLVEQFTSTSCTYCPAGTANIKNLSDMRGDIAWVAIHDIQNPTNPDPFTTSQGDSITSYQRINGFPEGTFDRSMGMNGNNLYAVISGMPASEMSTFLDYVSETPAWATINVSSTYDPETRQAVITIDGQTEVDFDTRMGSDSKLSVYLTEDGLVAPQVSGGNDYVHNNVFRTAIGSIKGVDLNRTDNTYKNEFTIVIPEAWNADNMNIVAFISRPLRANALTDLYVTNANKRKLGENDDEPAVIPGDVDGNGTINIGDVTMLIQYVLSGQADGINLDAADFTQDGTVNINDVTSLIAEVLSH